MKSLRVLKLSGCRLFSTLKKKKLEKLETGSPTTTGARSQQRQLLLQRPRPRLERFPGGSCPTMTTIERGARGGDFSSQQSSPSSSSPPLHHLLLRLCLPQGLRAEVIGHISCGRLAQLHHRTSVELLEPLEAVAALCKRASGRCRRKRSRRAREVTRRRKRVTRQSTPSAAARRGPFRLCLFFFSSSSSAATGLVYRRRWC